MDSSAFQKSRYDDIYKNILKIQEARRSKNPKNVSLENISDIQELYKQINIVQKQLTNVSRQGSQSPKSDACQPKKGDSPTKICYSKIDCTKSQKR